MKNVRNVSRDRLRELIFQPLSSEEIETSRKADEDARWLLALNLQKMEEEGSIQVIRVKVPLKFRKRKE